MIEESESPALTKRGRPRKKMGPQSEESCQTAAERGRTSRQSEIVKNVGVILPACPTTAQELVNSWEVSPADVESHGVLIFRQIMGTDTRELLARVPMTQYQLSEIAAKHGSGTYYIKGTAGRYERKAGKFSVSSDYAASCGYGRLPEPPKPADVQAVRTLERAASGGSVDPVDLAAAIQRASEETTRRILESYGIHGNPGTAPQGPTFQGMESQFQQVEKMYGFMERMEQRAMESVERRMGIAPTVKDETDPNSWAGILSALAPVVLPFAQQLLSRAPIQAHQPVAAAQPVQPAEQHSIPAGDNMLRIDVPQEILDRIAPAVAMLKPFKAMLLNMDRPDKAIADTADMLGGFIPPACYDAILALAEQAKTTGPEIMRVIGPEFVTPRWVAIVDHIAGEIKAEDEPTNV